MIYEFTLSHPVIGDLIISEPGGWKDTKMRLERHPEFHSVVEYFGGGEDDDNAGDFIFYGDNGVINGGIDRIREVIAAYGPDTDLFVFIRISFDNYTFYNAFSGQLALWGVRWLPNNKVQIPITRGNLWSKFINRLDTPVDIQSPLSLDGDPVDVIPHINMTLTGQKIQKITNYEGEILPADEVVYEIPPTIQEIDDDGATMTMDVYTQANIDINQDEISDSFNTLLDFVTLVSDIAPAIEMNEEGGQITVIVNPFTALLQFEGSLTADSVEADPSVVDSISIIMNVYVQKNSDSPILIGSGVSDTNSGGYTTPIPLFPVFIVRGFSLDHAGGSTSLTLIPSDTVKAYINYQLVYAINVGVDTGVIKWVDRELQLTSLDTEITYTIQSTFRDTQAEVFLTHDVGGSVLDRIVSQDEVLYSEFLGGSGTHRSYGADGCGYPYVNVKGLQIRQYDLIEKPFFTSFKQWWNGINPILNLCLFQDTINGVEVIRIEEKAVAYDQSTVSVRLSNVIFIDGGYDETVTFKTVETGNKEWKSESFTSIDDWAKQTRASRIQKAGTDAVVESEFIAAPLAIESVRRSVLKKSENNKFDDNTFIIAVNEDYSGSPTVFTPQLDEHFTSITNLLNPETRYNSILTPARSFFRWLNYFSIGLQEYLGSLFKFTAGEGNYDMTSDYAVSDGCENYDPVVSEKMDIEVSPAPLHTNKKFNIDCPMEWEDYLAIQALPNSSIELSQNTADHKKFFIIDLVFQPFKSRASGNVWAVDIDFEIQVIQTEILGRVCDAVVDECEDALLTEDGFDLITEDGECLVLE